MAGDGLQVLPPGAGYGIVIGIGGVFALLMLGITWLQNRYVSIFKETVGSNILIWHADSILHASSRRIQHGFEIHQTWAYCCWNRFIVDMVSHVVDLIDIRLQLWSKQRTKLSSRRKS